MDNRQLEGFRNRNAESLEMRDWKTIGERLRRARMEAGFTQEQLGEALGGFAGSTIMRYEGPKRLQPIPRVTFERWCALLKVATKAVTEGTNVTFASGEVKRRVTKKRAAEAKVNGGPRGEDAPSFGERVDGLLGLIDGMKTPELLTLLRVCVQVKGHPIKIEHAGEVVK
jgi:transcriptional regulator with XRE-family HTH domain